MEDTMGKTRGAGREASQEKQGVETAIFAGRNGNPFGIHERPWFCYNSPAGFQPGVFLSGEWVR
jgi:hypothetical protein